MNSLNHIWIPLSAATCLSSSSLAQGLTELVTFVTRSTDATTHQRVVTVHGRSDIDPFAFDAPVASIGSCVVTNGSFEDGLGGWDVTVSPGGPPDGSVAAENDEAVLREGRSFLTTLSQGICVASSTEALRFDLVEVGLDSTSGVIPDAFEVSLLDQDLNPVVASWSPFATSFFNVQEDGTVFSAPGVTVTGTTVTLDLNSVAVNNATLYFDLIGADVDDGGFVIVDGVGLEGDGVGIEFCVGVGCPCGNDSSIGGCSSTLGTGALLRGSNSASIAQDDLVLTVDPVPASFAYFFVGGAETCSPLGDGLLGVAPGPYQSGLMRFLVQSAEGTGELELGPGLIDFANTSIGGGGFITVGSTWYFQVAYRDAPVSPCGALFNLSNGLAITFAP